LEKSSQNNNEGRKDQKSEGMVVIKHRHYDLIKLAEEKKWEKATRAERTSKDKSASRRTKENAKVHGGGTRQRGESIRMIGMGLKTQTSFRPEDKTW